MDLNPYARFLSGADPLAVLPATPERIEGFCSGLTAEQLGQAPSSGKWSIAEIVAHLADCELVFSVRLRQTLAQDHHVIQPFDQDQWAARYGAYLFVPALELFRAARAWNIRLLAGIKQEELSKSVTHPERGTMTFWTIVETMAGHDINHLQQIERLASTWKAA